MVSLDPTRRSDHLTFKGNIKHSRHGWLRLTPAFSVHLVNALLDHSVRPNDYVLDPFCGTGTTALACAERGIRCDTSDINPFLLWLAQAKCSAFTPSDIASFRESSRTVAQAIVAEGIEPPWIPPLHQIEKWWNTQRLAALGRAMHRIKEMAPALSTQTLDLLKIAFCRTMIEKADVSFGHQSMSFQRREGVSLLSALYSEADLVCEKWTETVATIAHAASLPVATSPRILHCDARTMHGTLSANTYTCVITSPPYPNRMSYIRELRPYMYWLGYLNGAREAGELDWQAIGGTWGCATSNVGKWQPETDTAIPHKPFPQILAMIAETSPLLSRYVHKYFYDMVFHCRDLFAVVKPHGVVNYIVGNSKFYNVMLPVEEIYADLFRAVGFVHVAIKTIRKRTSKKELFEFVVSARKPC